MNRYLSSILGFAATAAFALIVTVDGQSNVTARVIDGTIFPLVDIAQTQIIHGKPETHLEAAAANKVYLRRHCNNHRTWIGLSATPCGYKH